MTADSARVSANRWLAGWRSDPDLAIDPRVMVPVAAEAGMRFWAVIGVKIYKVRTEFMAGYEPQVVRTSGDCGFRSFVPHVYYLLVDEQIEVKGLSDEPLTREEFRSVCDRYRTTEAIGAALGGIL